jgi:DNA polymerase (family 10)
LRRDPFSLDLERIVDESKKRGVIMELNAFPDRLDLKDVHLRMAKERGVKIVISTDAHSTIHLGWMRYGVKTARRGWLEKKDVINTLPVEKMLAQLRGGRP